MDVDALDYELPEELIAQEPLEERDASRLLVVSRGGDAPPAHHGVRELPSLLPPALFVLNDTRVLPARLFGHKPTGGRVELLLVSRVGPPGREETWTALGRASKGLAPGATFTLSGPGAAEGAPHLEAEVLAREDGGAIRVRLTAQVAAGGAETVRDVLGVIGAIPLPPYIRRAATDADSARYQTVFAEREGAVAAPTAGLHLSKALLGALEAAGHRLARVTLHVGPGTFAPLRAERLEDHVMHAERYEVSAATASAIREAKAEGRPVVAVGTTVVRTLEGVAAEHGEVVAAAGETRLFIRPPYEFRVIDALFTNFHLPRSTLLALVMAFGGVEPIRAAYREAVRERYRFFSYGDAMLVRP